MIYWDYNAGAPVLPAVRELLREAFEREVGNPSSVHTAGRAGRKLLDDARASIASTVGCMPREVVFTGSGSEAAAIGIIGAYRARKVIEKRTIVTSTIEHPAVLGAMKQLEAEGAQVVRVAPGPNGQVDEAAFIGALTSDTFMASLMWVNNETGVIQPVHGVSRACLERGIVFHTDAVQAAGKVPLTLREVPADLLSLSGHKLGTPPGIGVLINERQLAVAGLTPGHQENGRRGGTQNALAARAMALALELAHRSLDHETTRVSAIRDRFERALRERVPGVVVNSAEAARVANTCSVRFPNVDGEGLLVALDLDGICVSAGAACASGSLSPSHVLKAMGMTAQQAHETLRFSIGWKTQDAEVDAVVESIVRNLPRFQQED